MNTMFLSITRDKDGSQVVRSPRATDTIGQALRGAFSEGTGLPDEMVRILQRLDRMPAPRL